MIDSESTEQLLEKGVVAHRLGDYQRAEEFYTKVLKRSPLHFDALHLTGVIALQRRDFLSAVNLIDCAIAVNRDHAPAYNNRGNALRALRRYDDAIESFDCAIRLDSNYAEAYNNRGVALQEIKRLEESILSFERSITLNPDYAEAYSNQGNALAQLQRFEDAVASISRAISLKPNDPDYQYNLGVVYEKLKRFEDAIECYDEVIRLKRDHAAAYNNRGVALQRLYKFEDALKSHELAIAINPNFAEAFYNKGSALTELGRIAEAIESYDSSLRVRPSYAAALWNKSITSLLSGNFDIGWELYEWRWKRDDSGKVAPRRFQKPLWLGRENLRGRTLLIHAEQGLGDTIQFCRYITIVKAALSPRVVLEAPSALLHVLQNLDGIDKMICKGEPLPRFDYHCPMMSLPLALRSHIRSIPSTDRYLSSDEGRRRKWAGILGTKKQLRVGLAWSGSASNQNDYKRSIRLQELLSALPKQFDYISLQKSVRDRDTPGLFDYQFRHFGNTSDFDSTPFADTAALCDLMDVVISVDTSIAHLAGALGRPTWVLLPFIPDWRWMLDRNDSPWYPSMTLFRQSKNRDWGSPLKKIAEGLHGFAAQA